MDASIEAIAAALCRLAAEYMGNEKSEFRQAASILLGVSVAISQRRVVDLQTTLQMRELYRRINTKRDSDTQRKKTKNLREQILLVKRCTKELPRGEALALFTILRILGKCLSLNELTLWHEETKTHLTILEEIVKKTIPI